MASINYAAREISVKIVYYGPGLSGKTTNLQVIHRKVPPEYKSDMVSLATETDRTLFFDFLPLDLGKIKGFSTKFQLYTVPGQVYYNATRKLVLRGVDGVVFVADSGPDKMPENLESFQNLEENLAEYGYKRETIPIILQYNKRDLPNALPVEEIQRQFNKYDLPFSEAVANKGIGVFDSLKLIGKIVIDYLNKKYSRPARPGENATAPITQQMQRPQAPQMPPSRQQFPQQSQPQQSQQFQNFQQNPAGFNQSGGFNQQNTFAPQQFQQQPPAQQQFQQQPPAQQQFQQPAQQQFQGFQQSGNVQMPPQARPQPPRAPSPQASGIPPMMPTPSQLQARPFPQQQQGSNFQRPPAGFGNPVPPVQQGTVRPQQMAQPPAYQQQMPAQGRMPAQQGMQQQQPQKSSAPFQQNFQNVSRPQQADPFSNDITFEPEAPAFQQQQDASYAKGDYFNYGNVNIQQQDAPEFEQSNDYSQVDHEDTFEIQAPAHTMSQQPMASQSQKTELDLEIEKYQREIEEKQRRMRVQGQGQQMMPPAQQQQPMQQQPRMQQPMQSHMQTQQHQESEQDYDVYNMEVSGYQDMSQPPTQRQPAVSAADNDDDMYFTSIDTDRQKKPIRKPVNPRMQQQKGFLSKFFNGNNREMP